MQRPLRGHSGMTAEPERTHPGECRICIRNPGDLHMLAIVLTAVDTGATHFA